MTKNLELPKGKLGIIVVDMQKDFGQPGGALYCTGGEKLVEPINKFLKQLEAHDPFFAFTRDWHPTETPHFGNPPDYKTTWPKHCVALSPGAEYMNGLYFPEKAWHFIKGYEPVDGGYSGFDGVATYPADQVAKKITDITLHDALQTCGHIETVYVFGIATDYCVKATVLDALKLGYKTHLVRNLCVGVAADTSAQAFADMADGVTMHSTF